MGESLQTAAGVLHSKLARRVRLITSPNLATMSESLVVIRTFGSLMQADEAQMELLNAGIYSLLMSDDTFELDSGERREGIALAVHRRDADVATAVLSPLADTG